MRPLLRPLVLAAAACLAACSSSTEVQPDQAALDAAAQFQSLADDAFRAGADAEIITAYRDIGTALGRSGRVSPITVVVDGTPLDFLATAQQLETSGGPACAASDVFCAALPPLRSIIAWDKANPRRVVQLTVSAGSSGLGPQTPSMLLLTPPAISGLFYFDGAGGAYIGTGGTQQIGDPVLTDTPCRTTPLPPSGSSVPDLVRCTQAEFTASFNGTVGVPPFAIRANAATGTHTISMASQPVHGARLQVTLPAICPLCGAYPPAALPPVYFPNAELRTTLSAAATASLVTLDLQVTNVQTVPVTLQFGSGQQSDFRIRRLDGSTVWLWSADKTFTTALGSRTLAPGETATYSATWVPTVHGSFIAEGRLTSTSHAAGSSVPLSIP
jgi:hypothetical protein